MHACYHVLTWAELRTWDVYTGAYPGFCVWGCSSYLIIRRPHNNYGAVATKQSTLLANKPFALNKKYARHCMTSRPEY